MKPPLAAKTANVSSPKKLLARPDVREYLLELQAQARRKFEVSRDDVVVGFKRAAELAELLEDPMAMIAAHRELAKLFGLYEPETKRLILSTEQEHRRQQLETLDEGMLLDLAGSDVIDAEFSLVQLDS